MSNESSRRRAVPNRRGADGQVTAEAAVVLPVVALFAMCLLWMISLGIAQVRAVDAARDTARALARGDSAAAAVALGVDQAPRGTTIDVSRVDGTISTRVTVRARPPAWLLVPLPSVDLHAAATTTDEGDHND